MAGKKQTMYLVKQLLDFIYKGHKVVYNNKEVIGGKTYQTATIGYKYKLIYKGLGGSLLIKNEESSYEPIHISYLNFMFLFMFCKLYNKVLKDCNIINYKGSSSS